MVPILFLKNREHVEVYPRIVRINTCSVRLTWRFPISYFVKLIITDTFYEYNNKTEVNHFVSLIFIECLALVFQICFQFGCMNTDMRFLSTERRLYEYILSSVRRSENSERKGPTDYWVGQQLNKISH